MGTVIYEIPNSVKDLFEQGENSYRIIDYSIREMDNIESMQYFLDCIGATSDNIEVDDGTQVIIVHPEPFKRWALVEYLKLVALTFEL